MKKKQPFLKWLKISKFLVRCKGSKTNHVPLLILLSRHIQLRFFFFRLKFMKSGPLFAHRPKPFSCDIVIDVRLQFFFFAFPKNYKIRLQFVFFLFLKKKFYPYEKYFPVTFSKSGSKAAYNVVCAPPIGVL